MFLQVKCTEAVLLALLTFASTFGAGYTVAKQQAQPHQAKPSFHTERIVCLNPTNVTKLAKKQRG
jgi:hypothetical protein